MDYVDFQGNYLGPYASPHRNPEWFKVQAIFGNVLGNGCLTLNWKLLGESALYEYLTTEDWYLWLRLFFEGAGRPVKFKHVYEPVLNHYRRHFQGQLTNYD